MKRLILRPMALGFAFSLVYLCAAPSSPAAPVPLDCGEGQERCTCTGSISCHSGPSRIISCPFDLTAPGPCWQLSSALIDLCVEKTMSELHVTNKRLVSCSSGLACVPRGGS